MLLVLAFWHGGVEGYLRWSTVMICSGNVLAAVSAWTCAPAPKRKKPKTVWDKAIRGTSKTAVRFSWIVLGVAVAWLLRSSPSEGPTAAYIADRVAVLIMGFAALAALRLLVLLMSQMRRLSDEERAVMTAAMVTPGLTGLRFFERFPLIPALQVHGWRLAHSRRGVLTVVVSLWAGAWASSG